MKIEYSSTKTIEIFRCWFLSFFFIYCYFVEYRHERQFVLLIFHASHFPTLVGIKSEIVAVEFLFLFGEIQQNFAYIYNLWKPNENVFDFLKRNYKCIRSTCNASLEVLMKRRTLTVHRLCLQNIKLARVYICYRKTMNKQLNACH